MAQVRSIVWVMGRPGHYLIDMIVDEIAPFEHHLNQAEIYITWLLLSLNDLDAQ